VIAQIAWLRAKQIGGSACGYQEFCAPLATPSTVDRQAARPHVHAWQARSVNALFYRWAARLHVIY
jgi:hypothetical protein